MKRRDLLKGAAAGSMAMTGCGSGSDVATSAAEVLPTSGTSPALAPAPGAVGA